MYPVELAYLSEPTEDYVKEAVKTVWNLNLKGGVRNGGDILIFLTGREEIERALYEFSEMLPTYAYFPDIWSPSSKFKRISHFFY